MLRRPDLLRIGGLLGAIALTFGVFVVWPQLDLRVSGMFFDGRVFPAALDRRIEGLRLGLWDAMYGTLALAVGGWAFAVLTRRPVLGVAARGWAYLVAVYLLGPGALVNGVLKRYWGRARPADVVEFGGAARFTPPYQITDQCSANCSFVSGEVAGATAMTIVLVVCLAGLRPRLAPSVHRAGMILALSLPLLCALQRVAAGRHFLSDAMLAMLFVALIAALLAPLFGAGRGLPRQG